MVNSPISIPLALSQSRKPSELVKTQAIAADALKIEHYVNSRMEKEYVREFDFAELAVNLFIDRGRVGALLSKLAGHENAITVCNPQKRPRTPAAERMTNRGNIQSDASAPAWIAPTSLASVATG
jgi:hypothetical protein